MNTFTATMITEDKKLTASITIEDKNTTISFSSNFLHTYLGFKNQSFLTSNIKDYPNFIATLIKKLDVNSFFTSVIIDNSIYPILPFGKVKEYLIINNIEEQNFINISDCFVAKEDLNFKYTKTKVPSDFDYTKNTKLNQILTFNMMDIFYDRSINTRILQALKLTKLKPELKKSDFIFVCSDGSVLTSRPTNTECLAVIPNVFFA